MFKKLFFLLLSPPHFFWSTCGRVYSKLAVINTANTAGSLNPWLSGFSIKFVNQNQNWVKV